MKSIKSLFSISLVLTSFAFFSCQSDSSGSNTNNPQPSNDYWPTAINNAWTYQQNGTNLPPVKIVGTETINGNPYFKFAPQSNSGYTITTYLRKSGGVYYIKTSDATFSSQGITGTQTGFEYIILKDNLQVDETWEGSYDQTTTYSGISTVVQSTTYSGTILAKDVTEIINNVTYPNVIKLNLHQETNSPGSFAIVNTEYWFAKNIGIIYSKTYSGSGIYTTTLINHTFY